MNPVPATTPQAKAWHRAKKFPVLFVDSVTKSHCGKEQVIFKVVRPMENLPEKDVMKGIWFEERFAELIALEITHPDWLGFFQPGMEYAAGFVLSDFAPPQNEVIDVKLSVLDARPWIIGGLREYEKRINAINEKVRENVKPGQILSEAEQFLLELMEDFSGYIASLDSRLKTVPANQKTAKDLESNDLLRELGELYRKLDDFHCSMDNEDPKTKLMLNYKMSALQMFWRVQAQVRGTVPTGIKCFQCGAEHQLRTSADPTLERGAHPRRNDLLQLTPAEMAIRNAVAEVEKVGAHPILTDLVFRLQSCQSMLADYIDSPKGDQS